MITFAPVRAAIASTASGGNDRITELLSMAPEFICFFRSFETLARCSAAIVTDEKSRTTLAVRAMKVRRRVVDSRTILAM